MSALPGQTAVNHFVNRPFTEMIHGSTTAVSGAGGQGNFGEQGLGKMPAAVQERVYGFSIGRYIFSRADEPRTSGTSPSPPRCASF